MNEKLSKAVKELWQNPEYIKKQTEAHLGKPGYWTGKKRIFSEKHKANLRGRKLSEETKRKMSLAHKGQPMMGKPFGKGEKHPNWKNGKTMQEGYIMILNPEHPYSINRYVFEHRLIIEKYLGRYLNPEERIHHLNNIKTDNRIENLKLFPNESEHQKFHHKSI